MIKRCCSIICLLIFANCQSTGLTPEGTADASRGCIESQEGCYVPIKHNEAWLKETSLVDEARDLECPKAPELYRMTSYGKFTLVDVIKNMLGDERAEYKSWAMSKLLKDQGFNEKSLTLKQWQDLKQEAAKILEKKVAENLRVGQSELSKLKKASGFKTYGERVFKQDDLAKCVLFARDSQRDTWEKNTLETKQKSWGIAFATLYDSASTPNVSLTENIGRIDLTKPGHSVVFDIREFVPRAAFTILGYDDRGSLYSSHYRASVSSKLSGSSLDTGDEYYVPIVVPFHDIKSAISSSYQGADHFHSLVKKETADQKGLLEIEIHKEVKQPDKAHEVGALEGRIIPCKKNEQCLSDPVAPSDIELKELVDAATDIKGVNGYRYKYVATPAL